MSDGLTTRLEHGRRLDLRATWFAVNTVFTGVNSKLAKGHGVRAFHTPEGPVEIEAMGGDGSVVARAWGDGARFALDRLPLLLGLGDGIEDWRPKHELVRDLHRKNLGSRHAHHGDIASLAVQVIFAQLVAGKEASRSWNGLARAHGGTSPGPYALPMSPHPEVIAGLSRSQLVQIGALGKMADAIQRVMRHRKRIEELSWSDPAALCELLESLRGIGPWTVGILRLRGLGDVDAVPVGDYNLPNVVRWALERQPRGDDARMLELLEPFAGYRGRVVRLLEENGQQAPRFGARKPVRSLKTW